MIHRACHFRANHCYSNQLSQSIRVVFQLPHSCLVGRDTRVSSCGGRHTCVCALRVWVYFRCEVNCSMVGAVCSIPLVDNDGMFVKLYSLPIHVIHSEYENFLQNLNTEKRITRGKHGHLHGNVSIKIIHIEYSTGINESAQR